MKVGFYLVWENKPLYYQMAKILVDSVKRSMPGIDIVQFTDEHSPAVHGVMVRRQPKQPLNLMRCSHFMSVGGDWVFVDSDVYFQQDVRNVFNVPFDIGLTDRNWPHLRQPLILDGMQSNVGVVFSRTPDFWAAIRNWFYDYPNQVDDWYGDQRAICSMATNIFWNVRALPGRVYNYPPLDATDPATDAAIVHCKGDRKDWMLRKSRLESGACA